MSLFEPDRLCVLWSQISNAPESNSSAVSLMNLKLRREGKKDYMKVAESKVGIRLWDS